MNKNVGTTDRLLRIILGAALIIYGIIAQSWIGLVGIIPLVTAAVNFCPLYTVCKINTAKKAE